MKHAPTMILAAVLLRALTTPSAAGAQEDGWLALDSDPVLLSTAMPGDTVCRFDEDDNGLNDEIETEIAQAFVPQFRFDAAERHTRPDEPHAVFNTTVSLDAKGNRIIVVRYVFVWHDDGGWVNARLCGGFHAGDTQPMTAKVRLVEQNRRWIAQLVELHGFIGVNVVARNKLQFDGTHPIVFPAAGKHHFYPRPDEYGYGAFGCTENAYGNLPALRRIPRVEHVPHGTWSRNLPPSWAKKANEYVDCNTHVPDNIAVCVDNPSDLKGFFEHAMCTVDGVPTGTQVPVVAAPWSACTDYPQWVAHADGRRRWINVCTKRRTGTLVAAVRSLRPLDLTDWGYPIQANSPSVLSRYFRSRDADGVYINSPNTAPDVDGDGLERWRDPCPMMASNDHGCVRE